MANLCRLLIPLLLPLLIWGNSPTSEKERQKEKTNTKSEVAEVDEKDASEASIPPEESNPNTKTNTKSEAPLPPQDSSPSSDYRSSGGHGMSIAEILGVQNSGLWWVLKWVEENFMNAPKPKRGSFDRG